MALLSISWLQQRFSAIREWCWLKRSRFGLAAAFLFVGGASFQAGLLQRSLRSEAPLVIEVPAPVPPPAPVVKITSPVGGIPTRSTTDDPSPGACALVGSRNSNKYHVPTSRCARAIKSENRRCFKDAAEAEAHGYVPGCLK